MKVMIINGSYPPVHCGVGDYTAKLAEAISARNPVVVVTSAIASVRREPGIEVLPMFRRWTVARFLRRGPVLARKRPDVVIFEYPFRLPHKHSALMFLGPLLGRLFFPRASVIFIVHEFAHSHARARRALQIGLYAAQRIVVTNDPDLNAIVRAYPAVEPKIQMTPPGSNIRRVRGTQEDIEVLRRSAGVSAAQTLFFFGFVWDPLKGFEDLLEAVQQPACDDVHVVASGALDLTLPYHAELARRISDLGLEERIHWLGYLEEDVAAKWMQAADLVVLPFRNGAAKNRTTLIAALVNGGAVVTTRGAAVPDWLRDGENALLVQPADPGALARAIERALSCPALRRRLGLAAWALGDCFDWSRVAAEVVGET